MAFEHPSGLAGARDRAPARPNTSDIVFRDGPEYFINGAELNELQSNQNRKRRRIGDMVSRDGDRISGAEIVVDRDNGVVSLSAGKIYIDGDVLQVPAMVINGVPMTGEVSVGVWLEKSYLTHEEDPTLLGLEPGTDAEGEPGAAREERVLAWGLSTDLTSDLYAQVYLIKDGAVLDNRTPTALSGVLGQIAGKDFDANGHYIIEGLKVEALGRVNGSQVFDIAPGAGSIQGYTRRRETSLRHSEPEQPELEAIAGEPHSFNGPTGGTAVVAVNRPPIAAVQSAIVTKRAVEQVVRGNTPNGTDPLQNSAVTEIESVVQGGTNYVLNADYQKSGDGVSWGPGGAEPVAGSSYTVTYLYNSAVVPDAVSDTEVTLSGGVEDEPVTLSYTSKLPRVDQLCLDIEGRPVYVKGISARQGAIAPRTPEGLLLLTDIKNDWLNKPVVLNNGTYRYTEDDHRRYYALLERMAISMDRLESKANALALGANADDTFFTDPLIDDSLRDPGASQTASVNRQTLQLGIEAVLIQPVAHAPITLDYEEEIVVRQELGTSEMPINPYANFTVMPGALRLDPAVDNWVEHVTVTGSPITREFTTAPDVPPGVTEFNASVTTQEAAIVIRQRLVDFTIEGFGVGEELETLTFDGIDVTPVGPLVADANGVITGTFHIPANVPVGRRRVRADGAAGAFAEAIYVAAGVINTQTVRRVILVARAAPQPVVVVNNITNVTNVIQQLTNPEVGGGGGEGGADPLAQSFRTPEPRQLVGVDVRFKTIGARTNGVRMQFAEMANGFPSTQVMAEAFVNMQTVNSDEWTPARIDTPVFVDAIRQRCFVWLTADPDHALAIARLGDVTEDQEYVSEQPDVIGVLFASANRFSWSILQDADLTYRLVAAKFTQTTKTVVLWTGALENVSDVQVRGNIEIPSRDCSAWYELVRANGQVIRLAPGQTVEFGEYLNETVTLRVVLNGTEKLSPVVYGPTTLVCGRIRTEGIYTSRVFPVRTEVGTDAEFTAVLTTVIPAGGTVAVHVDRADGNWTQVAEIKARELGNNWFERIYRLASFAEDEECRLRITLTGGPGARTRAALIRAFSK